MLEKMQFEMKEETKEMINYNHDLSDFPGEVCRKK